MSVRPLRIFYPSAAELLTDYRPHGEGLIAWNLLSRLAARGHHVVACVGALDVSGPVPFEVVEVGRRQRFESLEPFARRRVVARAFRERGGVHRFDVAHWLFPPDADQIVFSAARELPFFYGPHSAAWPGQPRRRRLGDLVRVAARPALRRGYRSSLRAAAAVFVSVPDAARELPDGVASRARVLPFGVDVDRFQWLPLPSEPVVLCVGSVTARKGLRTLIEALSCLESPARLAVAGDGPDMASLRQFALQLGVADRIDWLGSIPHDRVPQRVQGASLLCLPSLGEPFGMAILEAMASGRAVVAADGPGPRFLVAHGRGGLIVPRADARSLAAALRELLSDPRRLVSMGEYNRRRVEREFTWDRMVDDLEGAYAEFIKHD